MIIVLVTGGKREDVGWVEVHLFDNEEQAIKFKNEHTGDPEDKYWRYADIIDKGIKYQVIRYDVFID